MPVAAWNQAPSRQTCSANGLPTGRDMVPFSSNQRFVRGRRNVRSRARGSETRLKKKPSKPRRPLAFAMTVAKITHFFKDKNPGVLALVGTSGCGKHHAIAKVAEQGGVAVVRHDLAQGAVALSRLGACQLSISGLARAVHVLGNASEQFLRDYTWVKSTLAKVVLVADDVGPSMRASKVQVVRMQAMTAQAMAKSLFHDGDWDAETATRCAQLAMGDWHKLGSTVQLLRPDHRLAIHSSSDSVLASSRNDATSRSEHPSLYANRLLNGQASNIQQAFDLEVIAWAQSNLGLHCASVEEMASRQEAIAFADVLQASARSNQEVDLVGSDLCERALHQPGRTVQYAYGLYVNPWQRTDSGAVQLISDSFSKRKKASAIAKARALAEQRVDAPSGARKVGKRPRAKAAPNTAGAKAKANAKAVVKASAKAKPTFPRSTTQAHGAAATQEIAE